MGPIYWLTITNSTKTITKKAEYRKYTTISYELTPALQSPPIPHPLPEAAPKQKTSATATAPSQLVFRRRRYRLPDQMASFHRFKLRQGAKWTIERTTPFFSSCDNSPCRHRHRARTKPTYSPPGRSRRPAVGPPVPGLGLIKVQRAGPLLTQSRRFIYVEVIMFGSTQGERILGVEDGPRSIWTMMTNATPPRWRSPKHSREDDVLLRAWTSPAGDQGML